MKLLVTFFFLAVIYMANTMANASPPMEEARKAHVTLTTSKGKIFCGGFALAPHIVATAKHCTDAAMEHGARIYYNGVGCPEDKVVEIDSRDHVIVQTCATFTHFAKLAPPPPVGEHVFVWGHPDGMRLMYREGVVAGVYPQEHPWREIPAGAEVTFYDYNGYQGDSGSAIYNQKGEVVGMVSNGWSSNDGFFTLAGSYAFRFSLPTMKKYGVH